MFKYSDVKIAGKGGMCGGKNAVLQGFAFHCPQGEGYTSQETNTQAKKQTSKQASKVLKGRVTQVTQVKPPAFLPQIVTTGALYVNAPVHFLLLGKNLVIDGHKNL